MIVKDDSEYASLINALESAREFVDSIHITTTGKNTNEIKAIKGVQHSHFDWIDNFGAVRNFNFSQAPIDTDYIFWMDADDVLVGGEHLREIALLGKENNKDVLFFTYWYGCGFDEKGNMTEVLMEHMRERLLKPGATTWKKRLHETPVPVDGAKNTYSTIPYGEIPIAIMHTSKDIDLPEKMDRNKRILEMELEDEKKNNKVDPRTLLYLSKIYAEQDNPKQWDKVIEFNKEYQEKSGWDEERSTSWEQVGIVYMKKGDYKNSAQAFHTAIGPDGWCHQPLIYIRLATALYNCGNYRASQHWLDVASSMDLDNKGSNLTNIKAMKVLFADLLLKLNYNYKRDTKKALEAAKLLYKEVPTDVNKEQVAFLADLNDLNDACANTDKLSRYLSSIGEDKAVNGLLNALPEAIIGQPFAQKLRNEVIKPKVWGKKEICYFASFGAKHFEQWSGKSLERGIGGSETAVIELSKEWTKLGYKVTVYCDPQHEKGVIDGVTYLPWFEFNKNDQFNIFIQWRSAALAGKIKCNKYLVDLHDVFAGIDYSQDMLKSIDKIMVKSEYHRSLAPQIPDDKFSIISNGIRL